MKYPDPDALIQLEPEEIAGLLLDFWLAIPGGGDFIRRDLWLMPSLVEEYDRKYHDPLLRKISVAWGWLEREGLIAHQPNPNSYPGAYFVTERGERIRSKLDFDTFRLAASLPKQLLHPAIAEAVLPVYLRGKYSMAVFEAFRDLEDAVRKAAKATDRDVGVALMRKAFDKSSGPLSDMAANEGERQALSDLFAGAIGSYKNPSSHRRVELEAGEAAEMILLASHLMKIVEARAKP